MNVYLYSATPDQTLAATTLADLQLLIAATADPANPLNAATITRLTNRFAVTQGDSGVPLTVYSYDDSAGTVSGWVTDAAVTLAVGLGLPDPGASWALTNTDAFTISGSSRVGSLALNTTELQTALRSFVSPYRPERSAAPFVLQFRLTRSGLTETIARLPVEVAATVLAATLVSQSANATLQTGISDLTPGAESAALAFPAAFTAKPQCILPKIFAPDGSASGIDCWPDESTRTTTGVTIRFGAAIPASGYKLSYLAAA